MKNIKGYEGLYATTEDGQIWSFPKKMGNRQSIVGKFLKPWLIGNGYEMVMLWKDLKPKKFLTHRLVAQTFIPNVKNLPQVNHINGERRDNNFKNLEWCTSKQNIRHAMENGLVNNRGESHGAHKLTDKKVHKIKTLLSEGKVIKSEIARRFKVSASTIGDISHGKTWTHIVN